MSTPPPSAARPTLRVVGAAVLVVALGTGSAVMFLPALRTTMAQAPTKATPAKIDGDRAYGYLKAICDIGPRPAGTAANTKQRAMVAEHFTKHGGKVREQPFSGRRPDLERAGEHGQPDRLMVPRSA